MNLFSWRYAVGMTSLLAMTPVITSNPALAQAQNTNSTNPVAQSTMTVQVGSSGKKISPDLFGIFFEDLNYAADGGLYAELIQNRSFEYSKDDNQGDWNALTSWELVERGGAKGSVAVQTDQALHPNNPQYALLTVTQGGAGAGLINAGFDGIPVKAGEKYNFSCFARRVDGMPVPLEIQLESKDGQVYGKASINSLQKEWLKYSATIQSAANDTDARLVITTKSVGSVALDMVSLFPQKTFKNRPNGLRPDLAQTIADLHPKFMRFPGGCLAHGDGINNMYHWKNTIGPVERRKAQPNIWRYHQTTGLGYFEYFQFCEDIGAKPLPVVAAGVSCQNSGASITGKWGQGQQCIPMANMDEYIQDVLDLVEYANGPVTSTWGAKRAAAGHPKPFNLEYLGIGNEDHITPEFKVRFEMINKAVKAKYPDITVIGTVGPSPAGQDFEEGWKFANQLKLAMVDEHYYEQPQWFLNNLSRYDSYDRKQSKVYLGEYASWGSTLFNALSEAAYMTSLERNGDIVHLSSYAPLLAKRGRTQWNPDLIYFDNTSIVRSPNYYVQQLYSTNAGDRYLPTKVNITAPPVVSQQPVNVFLGTWNTQAQFDDIRIESANTPILNESFDTAPKGWAEESGDWKTVDGTYCQTSNQQPALAQISATKIEPKNGKLDYVFSLRARKTAGQEGFLIGFGAKDNSNYYWWNLGGWGNTKHGIEKKYNGSIGVIGEQVPGSIELNRWYDLKVVVSGSRIQCFVDGKLIHDVTDDAKPSANTFVASAVRDTKSGDTILKLVNVSPYAVRSEIQLSGLGKGTYPASKTVLAGEPGQTNSFSDPKLLVPQVSSVSVKNQFQYEAQPHSFTVFRIKNAN